MESEFKRVRKEGKSITDVTLKSPISDLVQAAIDSKRSSMAAGWTAPNGAEVVVIAIVSDCDGAVSALQTYEQGRDAFALKTANAVVNDIKANGLPEQINVKLHS